MTERYRYVSKFTDRHGVERAYLRYPGQGSVTLPTPIGSPAFIVEYKKAMKAAKDSPERATRELRKLQEWSGRRLATNVKQTMADAGVYILIRRGKIAYIGTSKNCAARICEHRTAGREFDKAYYIYAETGEREALERLLIRSLAPQKNKVGRRASNPDGPIAQGLEAT